MRLLLPVFLLCLAPVWAQRILCYLEEDTFNYKVADSLLDNVRLCTHVIKVSFDIGKNIDEDTNEEEEESNSFQSLEGEEPNKEGEESNKEEEELDEEGEELDEEGEELDEEGEELDEEGEELDEEGEELDEEREELDEEREVTWDELETILKKKNPSIKILLGIRLPSTFMTKKGLNTFKKSLGEESLDPTDTQPDDTDGVDIMLIPSGPGLRDESRVAVISWLKEMKKALPQKLFTLTVLPGVDPRVYLDPEVVAAVDFFNLQAADFYTPKNSLKVAYHPHSMGKYEFLNEEPGDIHSILEGFTKAGVKGDRLNLGIATWGWSWTLQSRLSEPDGIPPLKTITKSTPERGISFDNICLFLRGTNKINVQQQRYVHSATNVAFYYPDINDGATKGVWIGFEDPRSAAQKVEWAFKSKFGGVALLDLGLDSLLGGYCGGALLITRTARHKLLELFHQEQHDKILRIWNEKVSPFTKVI